MITQDQAQEAISLLNKYISQCRGEISEAQILINEAKKILRLPENFRLEDIPGLHTRAYNTLVNYYRYYKGKRDVLNTSKKELLKIRDCGKKTVDLIESAFGAYGIKLIP